MDFIGKRICAEEFSVGNKDSLPKNFLINIYKDIFFPINGENFKIRISADDYYKLYINGTFVCQGPAPSYIFSYNYNEADITPYISKGKINQIRVAVYYQGLTNRVWVSGDGNQGMVCDIICDGKVIDFSDESWIYEKDNSFLTGDIFGYDTQFAEIRDFTLVPSGRKNCTAKENIYTFKNEPFPCIEVYPVTPEVIKKEKNKIFFDLTQEMVGTMKITVTSERDGEKLILHLGEETEGNSVRFNMRCNCKYEDVYILKKGRNIIEQFDYKAFRYGEILTSDKVKTESIEMLVRHFPYPEKTYDFGDVSPKLQSVLDLCINTIKYGTQETYVDCPTREKGQYLGDVTVAGFSHLYLTGETRLLRSAFENFRNSYKFSGEFLAVAPCSLKQKIADYTLQFPLNVIRYYEYTKDRAFLEEMLPVCDDICSYFSSFARKDGLLTKVDTHWNLVDWPDNLRDGYDFDLSDPVGDGCHNVINAFYIGAVMMTERIKDILSVPYEKKSHFLTESFNRTFLDSNPGLYKDSEVSNHCAFHSNVLPLYYGIAPEESKNSIISFLKEKRLSCGTYFSYFYLSALCLYGEKSFAEDIITCNDEHSWYNMINEGATTCFEAWGKEQKWNTSLFHPWSTSPLTVLCEEKENILKSIIFFTKE